jgi:putative transposase
MTYQSDFTLPYELLEQIASQGFDILPELIRIVLNAAMQGERQQYLGAAPYQHSPDRNGHANVYTSRRRSKLACVRSDLTCLKSAKVVFIPRRWKKGCAESGRFQEQRLKTER